ncbi:Uncharacterized protein FWK35_00020839 [Aphis craccivora]|uniref:Uncharacterized protein n=1 Tax=Aphis craccivora TaxID=307492 RepID=A0A6G0ZFM2_APHCR|nr:Uncharacterized protein FWK35_00020839 [Aphis craccivora]
MSNITNIFNTVLKSSSLHIFLIGSTTVCGILCYLDKKRVSDPNYRQNVKSTRQSAELARLNALRSRSTTFPAPHDPAGKLKFALCKINHAEQCLEVAIDDADYIGCGHCKGEASDVGCREEASACIAEALYVLSFQEAEVMLAKAKSLLPSETYTLVREKYAELKKNARR